MNMTNSGFNPLSDKLENEDCFGFHSEYYVDPDWRRTTPSAVKENAHKYFRKGYSQYSKYQDDIYFLRSEGSLKAGDYGVYVIKSNVQQKTSQAVRLHTKRSVDYHTYIAVNRRGYFLYDTETISLFGFDGREIYTHKFGRKESRHGHSRLECVYVYDNTVIYSETRQTAMSTDICRVNMLTGEKTLLWGTQKGDLAFDNYLRESYRQEWGRAWPFSLKGSKMNDITCRFLYANHHRVIAGYSKNLYEKGDHYQISYIINIDLAENKWSILDCFADPSWSSKINEDSLPPWDDRHIFSFNMLDDTMWVKTNDKDIRLVHTDIQGVVQLRGKYSVSWKLCALTDIKYRQKEYYHFDGRFACVPADTEEYRLTQDGGMKKITFHNFYNYALDFWCFDGIYLVPNEYQIHEFRNVTNGNVEYTLREYPSYDGSGMSVKQLIQAAERTPFYGGSGTSVKQLIQDEKLPVVVDDGPFPFMVGTRDRRLTLAAFRRGAGAPAMTRFRDQLLSYRKSLANKWDYNAFVGILLGVRGPKHGDAACMNFAIGQGDNGNNTRKTLEAKGLTSVFEKYRGKEIDETILLFDVEEEILAIAPEYAPIRETLQYYIKCIKR